MINLVIGMQWGDEGKGKIIDYFSKDADYVVKYNGGPNAGSHIRHNNKDIKLHHIPAGILNGKHVVLANGMVIDPNILEKEVQTLEENGISVKDKIFISSKAHVILEKHRQADSNETKLGTTRKGIGFAYADKMLRIGTRIGDLKEFFLASRVCDTTALLYELEEEDKKILLQGSQGFLLDIDHGSYPFVTSSSVGVGGALIGTGLHHKMINKVVGIVKAYQTRVGTGPFPTWSKEAELVLQEKGKEFGVTTGRPRKCGWLDLKMLKYACQLNGVDFLVITKLDVLSGLKTIPVGVDYLWSEKNNYEPFSEEGIFSVVYENLPGWKGEALSSKKIPDEMLDYVNFIGEETKVDIGMISYGPEKDDISTFFNIWFQTKLKK